MPLNRATPAAGRPSSVRPPWALENDAGLRDRDLAGLLNNPQALDNLAPPRQPGQADAGRKRVERPRHVPKLRAAAPPAQVRAGTTPADTAGGNGGRKEYATINPQRVYVGDRARDRGSQRCGEVMYVGPAEFAKGKTCVGLKLAKKRSQSMCDGKYHGERYFRCQPGFGQYIPIDDAEVLDESDPDYACAVQTPKAPSLVPAPAPTPSSGQSAPPAGAQARTPAAVQPQQPSRGPAIQRGARSSSGRGGNSALDHAMRDIVGLSKVKHAFNSIHNSVQMQRKRAEFGPPATPIMPMHAVNVFIGNPGTGKSSLARILADMLYKLGELQQPTVTEVSGKELGNGGYHSDDDPVAGAIRASKGGILMINDAHKLIDERSRSDTAGLRAISMLVKGCDTAAHHRRDLVLILSGPRTEMEDFLRGPGAPLARIVTTTLEFPDLSADECALVARSVAKEKGFKLAPELSDGILAEIFRSKLRRLDSQNSNGLAVHSVLMQAIRGQTDRVHSKGTCSKSSLTTLIEADFGEARSGAGGSGGASDGDGSEGNIAAVLARLDNVTGLADVKTFVRSMVATLELDQQRREMGMKPLNDATLHMIFAGNPGTGKTTIARVVADMLRTLGVLRTGHLVEADRSSLVAGYVGQTALKTTAMVKSALGGVLFIDEAYALVSNDKDTFGREALDTLIKLVEDYRDDLVVILAGYHDEMSTLLSHNPGVRSRFPNVINFPNYSAPELLEIFESMIKSDDLVLDSGGRASLKEELSQMEKVEDKENGNGRAMRNLLDRAKRRQALRLQELPGRKTMQQLQQLTAADICAS